MSFLASAKGTYLPRQVRKALRAMLAELTSHKLEVVLAPSKREEIAERGGMIRVLLDRNADWYRRMCADHPSTRKRDKRAPDTRIKRKDTILALEDMLRTGRAVAPYEHMILKYIPGFLKDQQAQMEQEREAAYQRRLEKRREARHQRSMDFDPSTF